MTEDALIKKLATQASSVTFHEVMDVVRQNYRYSPVHFSNGMGDSGVQNPAGSNEGACRIFAWAKLNNLSENQTLHCFGDYYRVDVLSNPDGCDHANIRSFMKIGWAGIHFSADPLEKR